MIEMNDFGQLGLSEQMLEAVAAKGFETPTQIQKLTIPKLLTQENDLIAQSQTGTGKTAAFGLPILQMLEPGHGVQAIILAPTRELALQVTEELLSYNRGRKLSVASIYGGASMSEQLRRLSKGIDIVVGTPGRTLDHIRRGTLDLSNVRFLVLDEADEMLNMGFIEDVEEIMSHTPEGRRAVMFSATMPQRIIRMSQKYMRDAEVVRVESNQMTTDLTDQIYFEVRESDKFDALTRIIDIEPEFYGIVFSRTKLGVDEIVNRLLERGYAAEGLHGDVSQAQREKTLKKFKKKQVNILIATDVAARGIDVNNLTHVINYSLPQDSESYVHRIGRTGRAGNQGTAITFISSSELRQFGFLKRDIKADIKKEKLPTPQDIVEVKRNKIKDDLREVVEDGNYADYGDMADEILAAYPAEVALSALLRLAFRSELDLNNYPEIRSFSVDRKGTARLFISIGRIDGYDVRKLVELLKRECGLKDNNINDIKLMDNYSFVSVPFADAEHVVRKLNNIRKGERPLAEIAKPDGAPDDRKPRGKKKQDGPKEYDGSAIGNADLRRPKKSGDAEKRPGRDGGAQSRRRDKGAGEDGGHERREKSVRRDSGDTKSGAVRRSFESGDKPQRADGKSAQAKDKSSGRRPAQEWNEKSGGRPAAPRTDKPAKSPKPAKPAREERIPDFSGISDNEGFDWSIFETGDNRWDDRPGKGKKKDKR